MRKKDLAVKLLSELEKIFPEATTELQNWETPFQFLVCILFSAQTTDRQVNKVTSSLFKKFPDANSISIAKLEDIEDTVGGINYFKTKARHLVQMSKILEEEFGGVPPKKIEELIKLPGVGYKTANVFLNDLYHANQGIAVDTHVSRVARMYGLTAESNPTKISHDLEKLYPKKDWYKVNSTFVLYGRYVLKAKRPDMERVVLKEYLVI